MSSDSETAKTYHLYTNGSWYVPVLLALYLPSFIGFWFVGGMLEGLNPWLFNGLALVMIVVNYLVASYLARKLTHQPLRVRFDDEQVTVDTFSRDLKTLKQSASCQLQDIANFQDAVLTEEQFRLKLRNGEVFRITPSGWNRENDDFEALVKDFKAHVLALNPDGSKEVIAYERYWFTGWRGKTLYVLSAGGLLGGIGLLITGLIGAESFSLSLIKLPAGMIIFSLLYLSQYHEWGGGDEDDE